MGQSRSLDGHRQDGPFHAATQCPMKATLLPYLPLAVVLTVAVRDALANRPIDQVVRLVGMVIFASNVRRQLLALLEDSRLTRGLAKTVAAGPRPCAAPPGSCSCRRGATRSPGCPTRPGCSTSSRLR